MVHRMARLTPARGAALGLLALALILALTMTRASVAAPRPATLPGITITGRDFSFDAPETIPAGPVSITFTNEGKEPHHAQLVRLNDGVTVERFLAQLQEEGDVAFGLVSIEGGPGMIAPGGRQEAILDLDPGAYLLLCAIPGADGVPHLAKGMIKPIQVVGNVAEVRLRDFSFTMPALSAGETTLRVINDGPQPHELVLFKLNPGKTVEDWLAAGDDPDAPPLAVEAGGFQAIKAGGEGWAKLNLTSGNYVAVCFIPDSASGKAHIELGMLAPFTVQ